MTRYPIEAQQVRPDPETGLPVLDREWVLRSHKGYWLLRRGQDILLSGLALIVLSPLLLLTGLAVFLDDPHGSPFFKQARCGRDGKLFCMYKFRSMYVDADQRLAALQTEGEMEGPVLRLRNDPRITRVGGFLRKTSIDELPQLWNVLKGDMSIVGPRPALPKEVALYKPIWRQRMYVTPGLTCIWQVTPNRDDVPFDRWVAMDLYYIQHRSFLLDWKLILKTFGAIAGEQGR